MHILSFWTFPVILWNRSISSGKQRHRQIGWSPLGLQLTCSTAKMQPRSVWTHFLRCCCLLCWLPLSGLCCKITLFTNYPKPALRMRREAAGCPSLQHKARTECLTNHGVPTTAQPLLSKKKTKQKPYEMFIKSSTTSDELRNIFKFLPQIST